MNPSSTSETRGSINFDESNENMEKTSSSSNTLSRKEFWKIMSYFKKKWALCLSVVLAILCGVIPLVINVYFSRFMNIFTFSSFTKEEFLKHFGINSGIILANVVCLSLNFAMKSYSNPAFMHDLREALYKQLMRQDIKFFDSVSTGILMNHLSQDITILYQIYIDKMLQIVQDLTQAFGGLILSFLTMWQVALPVTGIIGVCTIIYYIGDKIVHKLWEEFNQNKTRTMSKAEEVITSFRTVKAFDNEVYEIKQFGKKLKKLDSIIDKTSFSQGIKDAIIWGIITLMTAGFVYLAVFLIVRRPNLGYVSGDLLILIFCLIFSTQSISTILSLSDDFAKARVSAARILNILEKEPEVDQEKQGNKDLFSKSANNHNKFKGKIEFRNVGFRYKMKNNEWAVRNFSFTVEPGQTVALVGESGCGKSTTLQLIQRFYEIEEGNIFIDEINIKTINPQYLRSFVSIVPQGPVLFSMSIKENICYSRRMSEKRIDESENEIEKEEIISAARIGNAHNFIMEMPDNYESKVQQTSLSGGQKQRICISRAILANTPVLLLDEATAALDTESERLIQESLEKFRRGVTAIVVAHRLATVMNADKIIVMKEGHVEEEGTHQDLLKKNGLYANLVKFQLQ